MFDCEHFSEGEQQKKLLLTKRIKNMVENISKVTSDDVKNLVAGTVSKVNVRKYEDFSMKDVRYQIATDIETGDEVVLVYQGGSFWLESGECMQHLFNSSDDDEDVTYHDEDAAYNIELGDYDCAAEKINLCVIERLGSEGTHIDFGHFYMPMEHYIEYCFLTEIPRAKFETAPCSDRWCAACVDDDDNKLPVSDWYIAVVLYSKYGGDASDIRVRIGDVREDVGDDFSALENRGQLIIDMLNELSKRYRERLFPNVA